MNAPILVQLFILWLFEFAWKFAWVYNALSKFLLRGLEIGLFELQEPFAHSFTFLQ